MTAPAWTLRAPGRLSWGLFAMSSLSYRNLQCGSVRALRVGRTHPTSRELASQVKPERDDSN